MGGIIIVFRPRDFINVGVVLKVKSTLTIRELLLEVYRAQASLEVYIE